MSTNCLSKCNLPDMATSAKAMKKIAEAIIEADPRFRATIDESPLCTIDRKPTQETHFESLVASVISQQLAGKAAETIHGRVHALVSGKMTPARIVKLSDADLRAVGVSGAKSKTILGLGNAALSGEVRINDLHLIEDDDLIYKQLTSLWGIGPWTVDMFLMFQLGRLNVWPTGDLGVRRGWEKIHRMNDEITPTKLHNKGQKFEPYRSVVAWYCWRAADSK